MDNFPILSADKCVFLAASYGFVSFYSDLLLSRYECLLILLCTLYFIIDHFILVHYPKGRETTYYQITDSMTFFLLGHVISMYIIIKSSTVSAISVLIWLGSSIVSTNLRMVIDDEGWPSESIHFYHILNLSKGVPALYCFSRIIFILSTFYHWQNLR